ncbi:MAG: hypothetical protein HY226_03285 [Candidatus Vogelbacteria bacterium]|nr:hypothetical protein [Candidatus Vogelbacteria bacterium]
MKNFKNPLIVTTFAVILVTIISGVFLIFDYRQNGVLLDKSQLVSELQKDNLELSILQQDVFFYTTDRAFSQWQSESDNIKKLIEQISHKFKNPDEQLIINKLRQENKSVLDLNAQFLSTKDEPGMDEWRQLLEGQLFLKSQETNDLSVRLTNIVRKDLANSREISLYITASTIFVLLLLFFLIYAYAIRIKKNSRTITEQSEKISSYNQQLKASNQQLRAANQQLDAANQQLKASNQQLRAANQQLDASNQQLRATENNLKEKISEVEIFNKAAVGRELKMVELKQEAEKLRKSNKSS